MHTASCRPLPTSTHPQSHPAPHGTTLSPHGTDQSPFLQRTAHMCSVQVHKGTNDTVHALGQYHCSTRKPSARRFEIKPRPHLRPSHKASQLIGILIMANTLSCPHVPVLAFLTYHQRDEPPFAQRGRRQDHERLLQGAVREGTLSYPRVGSCSTHTCIIAGGLNCHAYPTLAKPSTPGNISSRTDILMGIENQTPRNEQSSERVIRHAWGDQTSIGDETCKDITALRPLSNTDTKGSASRNVTHPHTAERPCRTIQPKVAACKLPTSPQTNQEADLPAR